MRGIYLTIIVICCFGYYAFSEQTLATNQAEVVAEVIKVDNSQLTVIGSNRIGEQRLTVQFDQPQYGQTQAVAHNLLSGTIEYDEFYQPGDRILVAVQFNQLQQITQVKALSHYRMPFLLALFGLFAVALIVYAKKVGLRALLSFTGAVVIIWQLLIPGLLAGYPPLLITSITLAALSALIIISVAGWTYKGKAALAGTLVGLMVTSLLCVLSGELLKIDGMSQPMAQSLLFETGMHLSMLDVLYAAVLIGASGAAMDVAMEMAATMEELQLANPNLTRKALLQSGFRVGNAVIGTMTTTLLLAYSGGFLTLLMLFASRDVSLIQIVNMKLVASEIARTVIGSLSLVIVAPVTAWIASRMLIKHRVTQQNHASGGLIAQ
ncbi:YibE/F family protein [Ferrimonas senticii]|uniref:YibE/F family protein n=1 Tax=Ferrimonas senticii TaxID=394566 RepID=UPI0004245546|nr:YibE/F family protein [Ferrimonas senticii]